MKNITEAGKKNLSQWISKLANTNEQESAHQAAYGAMTKYDLVIKGTLPMTALKACTLCAYARDRFKRGEEITKCFKCPLYHCGHGCFADGSVYSQICQVEPSDKKPAIMHMRDILAELTELLKP